MPISGQSVAQQLARAIQGTQNELAEVRRLATSASGEIEEIRGDRDRTLAELARFYLPNLSRETLLTTWSEARDAIQQILLRKEQHVATLEQDLTDLAQSQSESESELETETATLDQLLLQQQSVASKLSDVLSQDAEFVQLTQQAAEAEAALERAEASLEQIEHEANQKLPAYEQSRLFMYLYRRGLATPTYAARGLTRRMDRWVGRLIDYSKAKIGYEYLKSMPDQVRALVAKDRESLNAVMAGLEQRRDVEGAKVGLPEIVARVQDAESRRDETLTRIDDIRTRTDQARSQLSHIQKPDGPYYEEAIKFFKALLESTDSATLQARASRTSDPNDDLIVARLNSLNVDARQATGQAAELQQKVEWLDKHLAELGQFQQRFRSARYDSSQSEFEGTFDLERDVRLVREGRESLEGVWTKLRRYQRFAPSSLETAGSGLARAASHPLTQVLIHAMANAASSGMADHAKRAGGRHANTSVSPTTWTRNSGGSRSSGSGRASQPKPSSSSSPSSNSGGFYTRRKI